ncbi:MAG TPA: PAS domain S-box protein, partial [Candidatus Manganitrophaceae bacterium]|nr:PAS domain S-box protein [Candidatus Manganitrophaceae bacterium]
MEPARHGRFGFPKESLSYKNKTYPHLCLIYDRPEEQLSAAVSFIREGLEQKERSLYLIDRPFASAVRKELKRAGVDAGSEIKKGALIFLQPQELFSGRTAAAPDAPARSLETLFKAAKGAGFSSLRVLIDMAWAGEKTRTEIGEFETELNLLRADILIVCQYDRRRFSSEKIKEVICSHPEVVYGGLICQNPYYLPPDGPEGDLSGPNEIRRMLRYLHSRQENEEALQKLNRQLEQEVLVRKKIERLLAAEQAVTHLLAESSIRSEYLTSDVVVNILQIICEGLEWKQGFFWRLDGRLNTMQCQVIWHAPSGAFSQFEALSRNMTFLPGEELPGRAWVGGAPAWVSDFSQEPDFFRAPIAAMEGIRGACAFPIWGGREIFGVMEFFSGERRPLDDDFLLVMASIGSKVGQFIERKRAEKAVREGEARKGAILESALDCIITFDHHGKIVEFNAAAEKTFGYRRDEVIGKETAETIIPSRLREEHRRAIKQYLSPDRESLLGRQIEMTAMRGDGSEFPVELAVTRVPLEGPPLFTCYLRDLSERKEAEARYQMLVEGVKDYAIFMLDPNGKVISWNGGAERIYGYPAGEIIGRDFSYFYSIDEIQAGKPASDLRTAALLGRLEEERWYLKKDGARFWTHTVITKLIDSQGRLAGFSKITRDLSERKKVEEALAEEKERLAVTLRSIGDGVITTDIEGKIVLMNKVAEELTGWTQKEAAGRSLDEVFHIIHQETRVRCEGPIQNVLNKGGIVELENHTALITRDRVERSIADSGAPIRDKEGKIIGVVLVFRDVTEKLKIEAEQFKASKIESIGVFAGGIAHDFNNILTAILGNVSLAKLSADRPDAFMERLSQAEKAAMRAKDLSQQLLTFAKGGAPVKRIASMADLIKEAAHLASSGSNARCDFQIDKELWPVEIDEGQISQVLHNLLINAQQAMPEGGIIKIRASNLPAESIRKKNLPIAPKDSIEVAVRDQGVG